MSSCLSSGGRTYALDLEMIKSTSTTSTITSHTSSPSSTLSESSNSGLTICTRKQRTPRKRPNQTYNEAATLLSTVYPNIFSTKHLTKPHKSKKPIYESFSDQSSDLLLPFQVTDNSCFLLRHSIIQEKPSYQIEPKVANCFEKQCLSQGEFDSHTNSSSIEMCNNYPEDDFDAESILDEEIEEGIDSIMGNLSVNTDTNHESNGHNWNWNPMGFGYGGRVEVGMGMGMGMGMRKGGVRAMRQVDEGNWWNFPTVDMLEISPRFNSKPQQASNLAPAMAEIKKKKKKKVETRESNSKLDEKLLNEENNNSAPISKPSTGLLLKLNYDEVLNSWSDKGTPFSDDVSVSDSPGNDVSVRLAQIDLFPEAGAVREASVMRYKEKRRTRLFSKKIRYQVRKVNADRRPRMKGRFVRRPNSSTGGQR